MSTHRFLAVCALCVVAAACGDDGDGRSASPSATIPPPQTASPTDTATPTGPANTATATIALPTASPTTAPIPRAVAKRIEDPADLIGGGLAVGRVGDYLIANDRIRAIIRQPGREMNLALTYGGNIIDADLAREAGEPGRDNFGGMTPIINLSLTVNVQDITVVNDGANGEPAVLRASGVDDLLDGFDLVNAIKAFGFGMVPPSAQDRDLPLEVATEYTLGLGDDAIRIETILTNTSSESFKTYVGDLLNGSGEDDTFVPSLGFGDALLRPDMPFVAFTGRGSNEGVSYGILPVPLPDTGLVASAFGQAGIMGYLFGQSFINVLLAQQEGIFEVPAGGTASYVRYFAVGDGDAGSISDVRNRIFGTPTGRLTGRVTVGGEPAAGAYVSVVTTPGEGDAPYNVRSAFRTDAQGFYEGTMPPGDYLVLAKVDGHPYDSGTNLPVGHPVGVGTGTAAVQDISIPTSGRLRVTITDATGGAAPAKVSVVGFDPAPEPGNGAGTFLFRADIHQQDKQLFGLTDVRFVGPSGVSDDIPLAPGDYQVVVSRGAEYSIHSERVTIRSGETSTVEARLAAVLDTTGFASADYHVHMIHSWDSPVTRDERILTMLAEGVDYFVASDHDFVTDLSPDLARLGVQDLVASAVSSEITTFNMGHYNAWPLERQPDAFTGGSIDWGRAGVAPGKDFPSLGSYDLSPAEVFETTRGRIAPGNDGGIILANHFNSPILGYFTLAGIDTALDPPQSFTDPTLVRQNPALTNLYDDDFDALEVWIEASRDETELFLTANLGDWFNLLNQGRVKAATADSDTHSTAIIQAGGPRNFVASSTDAPRDFDTAELAASVRQGRLIGSNAPFLRFTLEGDGGATAGLASGEPQLVPATDGLATIHLAIQSPSWAEFDTVLVFANTVPVAVPDESMHGVLVPSYDVEPTLVLHAGSDFTVGETVIDADIPGATRLDAEVDIPLIVDRDTWVMVVVRGTDDVSRPIWPMNPQDLDQESNTTLDDLTDGNLGEGGNPALAFTNPLYIDFDGNGRFDPSGGLP